ncbi:MAG: cache domain-containing protein [Pseudomonadota bacterium]|nr:cache domain-containing protein [Pseudomonadota bacterium]
MRKPIVFLCIFFLIVASAGFVCAQQKKGTAKEAVALVEKAMAYYKANGRTKAFAAFDDPKGAFVKNELYIFAIDWKGVILSHGANKKIINKPTWELRDSEGKFFMQDMVKVAQTKGKGWVDYKWTNPVTMKIEQKSSYVQRVPGEELLLGCGIYK